jgi:hypothetical protein
MVLCLGNKPCKYDDCFHYVEDCTDQQYKEHSFCGQCKHAYVNEPEPWWKTIFKRQEPIRMMNRFKQID